MRVLFRPHRGGLDQAMAECKEFHSAVELIEYVCDEYQKLFNGYAKFCNFHLEYYGFDYRIKWDTFVILDPVGVPFGWCAFNEDAQKEWKHE